MPWYYHLIAVVALAVACALWFVLQRFIARKAPELPGINRRCEDCTCGAAEGEPGGGECQRDEGQGGEPR